MSVKLKENRQKNRIRCIQTEKSWHRLVLFHFCYSGRAC